MTDMSMEKICVLCREDCSYKPRIKDSHGNYYCKTCHEAAEARSRQREAEKKAARMKSAPASTGADPLDMADAEHAARAAGDSGMDEALRGMDFDDSAGDLQLEDSHGAGRKHEASKETPPAVEAASDGPGDPYAIQPGSEMPSDMPPAEPDPEPLNMLEDIMGQEPDAGAPLALEIEAPPAATASPALVVQAAPASSGGAAWPKVIGIISLILGIGGLAESGYNIYLFVASVSEALSSGARGAGGVVGGGVIPFILAAYLTYAGLRVMRRHGAGAEAIQKWATIKTLLMITCGSFTLVSTVMGTGITGASMGLSQDEVNALGKEGLIVLVIGIILWRLVWPVFILIWFKRDKVQADIESWE